MKREIPLFIIDTKKSHKKGECDFLVCTDQNSGFIARIDYVDSVDPEYGEDYRIDYSNNGLSVKLSIKRIIGNNPNKSDIKNLMKKGLDYYADSVIMKVDAINANTEECIEFVEKLANGNKHYLQEVGVDHDELVIIKTSLMMLDAIKNRLRKLQMLEENE